MIKSNPLLSLKKILQLSVILFGSLLLIACTDFGYYFQCARGHLAVMQRTRPIAALLDDPQTPVELQAKLAKVNDIRAFAVADLGLPNNDSYRSYADIGRPYVVWNVVATPEFSLEPQTWCFPFAGCVAYRGYFEQAAAEAFGATLKAANLEVDVYGVQAYSTLSWFDDPVLNTFIGSSEDRLAGLLFHELAHQRFYLADDSAFNEAFAKTVEIEGIRRWLQRHAGAEQWRHFLQQEAQAERFQSFLREVREQLQDLYRQPLPAVEMRAAKKKLLTAAVEEYQRLQEGGTLDRRFDRWMSRGLNNARLASIATYRDLVPGFQALLERCAGDLARFYAEVERISKLPRVERLSLLKRPT